MKTRPRNIVIYDIPRVQKPEPVEYVGVVVPAIQAMDGIKALKHFLESHKNKPLRLTDSLDFDISVSSLLNKLINRQESLEAEHKEKVTKSSSVPVYDLHVLIDYEKPLSAMFDDDRNPLEVYHEYFQRKLYLQGPHKMAITTNRYRNMTTSCLFFHPNFQFLVNPKLNHHEGFLIESDEEDVSDSQTNSKKKQFDSDDDDYPLFR